MEHITKLAVNEITLETKPADYIKSPEAMPKVMEDLQTKQKGLNEP